jgi:hypothetical protein
MLEDGKYIDLGERIDNVNIYQAPDGGYMMRCKIDGEQQCARPLDDKQVETWNQYKDKKWNDLPKLVIAGQIHAETFQLMTQQRSQGRSW